MPYKQTQINKEHVSINVVRALSDFFPGKDFIPFNATSSNLKRLDIATVSLRRLQDRSTTTATSHPDKIVKVHLASILRRLISLVPSVFKFFLAFLVFFYKSVNFIESEVQKITLSLSISTSVTCPFSVQYFLIFFINSTNIAETLTPCITMLKTCICRSLFAKSGTQNTMGNKKNG